jgi:hypothetical protein
MSPQEAQDTLDKIFNKVFGHKNNLSLDQFAQKYAFDIRLPQEVKDVTTGETTYTQSVNPGKFISLENVWAKEDWYSQSKIPINGMEDILAAWSKINLISTNRHLNSLNVSKSDNIRNSENVYMSQDVGESKNVIFSDGVFNNSAYIAASQRSQSLSYCIRTEDSGECSNSFSVVWSGRVVNSLFIQDCTDLYECIFCSHINNKNFCIANMQFEEAEYFKIKADVVHWILEN